MARHRSRPSPRQIPITPRAPSASSPRPDELCKPGPDKVDYASFQADNIRCEGAILRTSNPPKREIGFTLDETRYVALVTVPVDGTIRLLDAPAHRHVPPR